MPLAQVAIQLLNLPLGVIWAWVPIGANISTGTMYQAFETEEKSRCKDKKVGWLLLSATDALQRDKERLRVKAK